MAELDRDVSISTGRRDGDGQLRLSVFAGDLLAVTLEGYGERAPTVLLTAEQAARLRDALSDLLPLLAAASSSPQQRETAGAQEQWPDVERRRRAV